MDPKKRVQLGVAVPSPSAATWKRLARWLLPAPGTILLVALLLWAQSAGALPLGRATLAGGPSTTTFHYQGRLADAEGAPIDGELLTFQFALYSTDADPEPLWGPEMHPDVPISDGLFAVTLGSQGLGIPTSVLGTDLWLEITVEGETLNPREKLASVPYAMQAMTVLDGAIRSRNMAPTVFRAFTEEDLVVEEDTEILTLEVDFVLDASYLIVVQVTSLHNGVGRVISSLKDESGNVITGASIQTRHDVSGLAGTQTGSVTTLHSLSAGAHTFRLVCSATNGTGLVRSAHVIAIPFAQAD